jgi:endo-1,4-beta-mannosidase
MVGVKVLVVVVVGLDHWGLRAQVIQWLIQILMEKGLTWSSM